ncbi:MAG: sensor histidine kinase [Tateyamaria sp.]
MRRELSTRGLFVRLAGLFTFALFPLGAISLWQTREVVNTTFELSERAILSETERAASRDRQLLERAIGATEGLGALLGPIGDDADRCSDLLSRFIDGQDIYTFAGYIDEAGMMNCSSTGAKLDFSNHPSFVRAMETRGQMFEMNLQGAVTGEAVLIVSTPVVIDDAFRGFVSLSIPHVLSAGSAVVASRTIGVEYVTVNRLGRLLSATSDMSEAGNLLPADTAPAALLSRVGETFVATAIDGRDRRFAVSSLIPGQVAVVGSWPTQGQGFDVDGNSLWLTLSFPVLMWFAGIVVAFWGLHRLVIRHIYRLRAAMRRLAAGEREKPELSLEGPPAEFEVLETSFNRMVHSLMSAEDRAERDLEDKTVLLREIHHRVKNNLQLIASIMNMHSRKAQTPEAKQLLAQLQMRVRGLATVHQTLNSTSHQVSVNAKSVLERLVAELTPAAASRLPGTRVKTDISDIQLGQDQAVTLSMLAAEALTNAVKYVGGDAGTSPLIRVEFGWAGAGVLKFAVSNSVPTHESVTSQNDFESSGIGSRLMNAFVGQLDGTERTETDGGMYRYVVTFDFADFDPGAPKPWATDEGAEVAERVES